MTVSRPVAFALVALAALAAAGAYLFYAVRREAPAPAAAATLLPASPDALPADEPWLLFRRASRDRQAGSLTAAPVARVADAHVVGEMVEGQPVSRFRCDRVHMAAGKGVCLSAKRGVVSTYSAIVFDETFGVQAELPLAGIPSRTQVSPDGTLAGTTVFVSGHSYSDGGFSTRTSLLDLTTGQWLVEDLETFSVRRDGQVIQSPDFNFWGVTFLRGERSFYATLGTKSETLLIKGDVDARTAEVVADQVECPSLSPDNRRLAFKQRAGGGLGPVQWHIWVLDLATGERHALAETRSVDDQVQWLDDGRVLYALPGQGSRVATMDQWTAAADGSGQPSLFLSEAYSAAIVRR